MLPRIKYVNQRKKENSCSLGEVKASEDERKNVHPPRIEISLNPRSDEPEKNVKAGFNTHGCASVDVEYAVHRSIKGCGHGDIFHARREDASGRRHAVTNLRLSLGFDACVILVTIARGTRQPTKAYSCLCVPVARETRPWLGTRWSGPAE